MAEKKNIAYLSEKHIEFHPVRHFLDIFYPDDLDEPAPVVVYIHGGTWISGSKDVYAPLGRNLANKGIVAVIINYRLGDMVDVEKMIWDCAKATKWVCNQIGEYGGDKNRIIISGHSAGGHLASLISLNNEFFNQIGVETNPVTKCILIDAFGLNIETFIVNHGQLYLNHIGRIFTKNPDVWKRATPANYVNSRQIPFLVWVGERTYPFLGMDNELFVQQLQKVNPTSSFEIIPGKSHIQMITQFDDRNNPLYKKMIDFISS